MKELDEVFKLLSQERRRYALYYLDQQEGTVSVDELGERISEWESGEANDDVSDEYDDVILTLEHEHLPRIADAEFVRYDRDENVVRITGMAPEASVILSVAEAIEQPSRDDVVRVEDLV